MVKRFTIFNENLSLADQIILQAKQKEAAKKKIIDNWVDNNIDFDKQKHIVLWEKIRKKYGASLVKDVLKIMALSNSVLDVNSILQTTMKMNNAEVDIGDFNQLLNKLFNVNMAESLLKEFNLSSEAKNSIIQRVIDIQFPIKQKKPVNTQSTVTDPSQLDPPRRESIRQRR